MPQDVTGEDARDAKVILNAALALGAPQVAPGRPDATPYVIVPEGGSLEWLESERAVPTRPIGTAKFRDALSFTAYFNRFADAGSLIYATLAPAAFVAVLDDHLATPALDNFLPRYREFRASFVVPTSVEWNTWMGPNRKHMTQLSFAEFIEDNLPDFVSPNGSDMLTMANNFEDSKTGAFKSAQKLASGSVNIQRIDETRTTPESGAIVVPPTFDIAIPVFDNGAKYPMTARLKYRAKDGALTIWYELVRPHKVIETAFRAIWKQIEDGTGKTILLGSPE